jgi:MtN3 and saliva related transmembrane protein
MMLFDKLIAWLGMACIVLCWIPQTMETLRAKYCAANKYFLLLTVIGAISLTIHSIVLNDWPFIILNSVAGIGASINLYFSVFGKPQTLS